MKTTLFNYQLLLAFLLILASCDRNNDRYEGIDSVTEEEAIEIIQETLVSEVYGVQIQIDDAVSIENTPSSKSQLECGILNERDLVRSSTVGASISFDHSIDYTFTLVCENEVPMAYAIDFVSNGTYSSVRMDSNDTITYKANLTNIGATEEPFNYNGSFLREGTQTTRIAGNDKDFDSRLSLQTTALLIDKQSRLVLSGSTEFSLTGNLDNGNTFSYTGTITYLGNGAATVVVNGNSYNVSL